MIIVIVAVLYVVGIGATFPILGEKYSKRDYWESPLPFFGSLVWPACLPAVIGNTVSRRVMDSSGLSRTERRRQREIEEAEHKQHLAAIQAKTTADLERALL